MAARNADFADAIPTSGGLDVVDVLVRDPNALLERAGDRRTHADLVRTMLWTTIACCAVFGAALGAYRGGVQTLYAAFKLPLAVLLTAGAALPALVATRAALGRRSPARDLVVAAISLGRGALVLGALAPILLLLASWGVDYHRLTLGAVACCAAAGAASWLTLWRGLADGGIAERRLVAAVTLFALGLTGAQVAWTLRPWLVRPRSVTVPFVRSLEGGFIDAVGTSVRSAVGDFSREEAPLPVQEGP